MNDTPLDCTGRPDCPGPYHLYGCRSTPHGESLGYGIDFSPYRERGEQVGTGITYNPDQPTYGSQLRYYRTCDENVDVHYGPQAQVELDRMKRVDQERIDGTHYDVAADFGTVRRAIDRMVAERVERSRAILERATEEALQGGKHGVRAFSKEGEVVFAEPHESVPYGQMHMHTVDPRPLAMEPFRWPL